MTRLDAALYGRGLATSRTHARRIVDEGRARVNGAAVAKPAHRVTDADRLEVVGAPDGGEYVSRAAHKLEGSLASLPRLAAAFAGANVLDIGSSTGGFTDVSLRRGATRVVAVDVGTGQLAARLLRDPRVTSLEGTDARALERRDVGKIDIVVTDVSFISLTHIVPVIARLTDPGAQALVMVKPQFEVGKVALPKSGVVTDPGQWRSVLEKVAQSAADVGLRLQRVEPSQLAGQDGNREFFLHLDKAAAPAPFTQAHCAMIEQAVIDARSTRKER